MTVETKSRLPVLRALAVYGAGAWVAVEVIGFLVSTYGLSRTIVDLAVLLVVSGALVTGIITWFHGMPGAQIFGRKERILLGVLGVLTVAGAVFLMFRDPTGVFHKLEGRRLVLEFPLPPPDLEELLDIRWSPPEGTVFFQNGWFVVSPTMFRLDMPGVSVRAQSHPVSFQSSSNKEAGLLTFVLPVLPSDVLSLLEIGRQHDSALVEIGGLSMVIHRPVTLLGSADSLMVRVEGRFSFPSGVPWTR